MSNTLLISWLLALGLFAGLSHAQDSDEAESPATEGATESQNPEDPDSPSPRDQIMALITNEVVIAPGVGLRNVRLGMPLTELSRRLGPAEEGVRVGFLRRRAVLRYRLDTDLEILVEGRRVVERMAIAGGPASLVRTVQGARFGMKRSTIQRIYRNPSKSRRSYLRYRHLGVDFIFADDQVTRIEVYPRRR